MKSVKQQCNINGGCEFCVGLAEKVQLRKDKCISEHFILLSQIESLARTAGLVSDCEESLSE